MATPMRRQYLQIKKHYPDVILFFRLGDFYETFDDDARVASKELEIVLTAREMAKGERIPMAGIPYHAAEGYISRLIQKGYKVAICEQTSDPATSKGLVDREVVRVVTPGTVVEPSMLESKANNYLAAIITDGEVAGISYVDITTGEFAATQAPFEGVLPELERLQPAEVILARGGQELPKSLAQPAVSFVEPWQVDAETAREVLQKQFNVSTLDGFGCGELPFAQRAAGAIVQYLIETQKAVLGQLTSLTTYSLESHMVLDAQTRRNLELLQTNRTGTAKGSLLSVMDYTRTPMGGRLLRKWISQPLLDLNELQARQRMVAYLAEDLSLRAKLSALLNKLADIERIANRISTGIASPRELIALKQSLQLVPNIKALLLDGEAADTRHQVAALIRAGADENIDERRNINTAVSMLMDQLKPCEDVIGVLDAAISDEPPSSMSEGGVIRRGFSEELDKIHEASQGAKSFVADLERKEKETTGIKSLKVGFNRVFGYYIEVSTANLAQVPDEYIRKQTLANAERYITPELKDYESTILNAHERIVELETSIFRQICSQVGAARTQLLSTAQALAFLDVFYSLAEAAVKYDYVCPQLSCGEDLVVRGGRHPVVERMLTEENFVPNDVVLSCNDSQIIVLTGPNMAGKSTYLRQVALIVLLAQIGSFVPAESAEIGLVDRIFTRVGAQDDLATGQSTFMVEMTETANILHNATRRSLIILDEIGRGTSTYDGLSIARAVLEYLHNSPNLGAKTLFATHYHELTETANILPRVRNCNVAVSEQGGDIVFLRRIIPGGADRSYGIHVGQMAGLPRSVVHRAQEILTELEAGTGKLAPHSSKRQSQIPQLSLFTATHPVVDDLEKLEVDSLTPLEAITKLYELQNKAKNGQNL